jgi:hypothetical protein
MWPALGKVDILYGAPKFRPRRIDHPLPRDISHRFESESTKPSQSRTHESFLVPRWKTR